MNTTNPQSHDVSLLIREDSARRPAHDLPVLRPETKDVLKQLNANLNQLEDLTGRLGFVLTEVRSLLRR